MFCDKGIGDKEALAERPIHLIGASLNERCFKFRAAPELYLFEGTGSCLSLYRAAAGFEFGSDLLHLGFAEREACDGVEGDADADDRNGCE